MEYGLARWVLGSNFFLPVEEQEIELASRKRGIVLASLAIEELYNLFAENYADLERELLNISLADMLFASGTQEMDFDRLHAANRRLANLLTSSRMYLDQVPSRVRDVTGSDADIDAFREQASLRYDSSIGYRVMEALRNHAQHRGLPVHWITCGWQRIGDTNGREYDVGLQLDTGLLAEDSSFKASILEELLQIGSERVPMKQWIRDYATDMRALHQWVRSKIEPEVGLADEFFIAAHDRYLAETGDPEDAGLAYVERRPDRTRGLRVWVTPLTITRRRWLEKKNRDLHQLGSRWVTGKAREWEPKPRNGA